MSLREKQRLLTPLCICLIISLCSDFRSYSQVHTNEVNKNKWLQLAEEQYMQGLYQSSVQSADKYISLDQSSIHSNNDENVEKAKYLLTSSLLKLFAANCEDSAVKMLHTTHNIAYRERIAYALAQYYFSLNDVQDAITYYEIAGVSNLSNTEIIEEKFELAYCYFTTKQFDKSEPLLASIKELKNGKYFSAGNYYYGLLAYNENNYLDALHSFERIKDLSQYKSIVPYYIAEIYYYTGNRKKSLDLALELIARPEKLFYDNELHLLAGQCYFEDEKYSEALPYFEFYYNHTDKIRKEDLYEMAYCYYKDNQWDNAIDKFKLLSNTRDSLGQTAMYLLGDCYLKNNDKPSARNAFALCAEMPFNPTQQEAAMILHSRLSYEMGYPDDALNQLNNLLTTYPSSKYHDEAKTLSSDLLIKTNNYEEAYKQLLDVTNKDEQYKKVYQKVTYGYALQLFQSGNFQAADSFLNLSLQSPVDHNYEAATYFWKGELAYRTHRNKEAINYLQNFLKLNVNKAAIQHISPAATVQHANLDMGYASMEQNDFKNAEPFFNQAKHTEEEDSGAINIATLREADAVFMQKDYAKAITLYNQIIAGHTSDTDYARFQKSKLLGLTGKKQEKINLLQTLINRVPQSRYANSARYELALEYIQENKFQPAINTLQPLTEAFDARAFSSKAWMKIGFAYQQLNNNEKAIEAYKHVVTEYPSSDEYKAALDAVKSLYIEQGQPGTYNQFLKQNNILSADSAQMDSTYYSAAESQFADSKWDKAKDAFTEYLDKYPKGAFSLKAHYYKAESNYQLKNYKEALPDYNTVLQAPWNDFSEISALRAANISFDQKDYSAAGKYYLMLRNSAMGQDKLRDAYSGLVKTSFNSKKYPEAIAYTDTLLTLPGVDDITMGDAMLYKAKALQATDKGEDALNIYRQLDNSKFGVVAPESRYHIAELLYDQGKLKEAETNANNNVRQSAGFDYWIVKSYILLADILTKEKDYFNAKATLQSIVKNAKIPELKEEAEQKLEKVKKLEKQHSKLEEQ